MENREPDMDNMPTCDVCSKAFGKYTCPRCDLNYCSVPCYRSNRHVDCSENFYLNCIKESLASETASSSSSSNHVSQPTHKKMNEIFQSLNEDAIAETLDSDDDEECHSLSERLAGVDLDDCNQVWEKLTADERQEFEAFLRSGDISEFVPKWQPWWTIKFNDRVQDLEAIECHMKTCPTILGDIRPLVEITSHEPNVSVYCNLANIIASYAFTVRYFNGCHHEFLSESVYSVFLLSANLRSACNFSSIDEAIESVHQECLASGWITIDAENINAMRDDTAAILAGPVETEKNHYILCAVSDLHELISRYLGEKGHTVKNQLFLPPHLIIPRKTIKAGFQKMRYLLAYSVSSILK